MLISFKKEAMIDSPTLQLLLSILVILMHNSVVWWIAGLIIFNWHFLVLHLRTQLFLIDMQNSLVLNIWLSVYQAVMELRLWCWFPSTMVQLNIKRIVEYSILTATLYCILMNIYCSGILWIRWFVTAFPKLYFVELMLPFCFFPFLLFKLSLLLSFSLLSRSFISYWRADMLDNDWFEEYHWFNSCYHWFEGWFCPCRERNHGEGLSLSNQNSSQ